MRSSRAIAIAIGTENASPAAPAVTRMRTISSEAYVEELIASEEKTASAFVLGSRSVMSASFASGRPMRTAFARAHARPTGVSGTEADAFAVSVAGPVQRKYALWGRSMRTRRSPSFLPWSGRRPPMG